MKRIPKLLVWLPLATLLAAGCESAYNREINEPSGAGMTNGAPEPQARDINQRPYPGADPYQDANRNFISPP
jgi:hypothetical protein